MNFSQAQQYLAESLTLREQMGSQVYLPFAHVAVADICLVQGNIEVASSHAQKALKLSLKTDIKKALIFSLVSCGYVCQAKEDKEQAKNYLEQAYSIAESIELRYVLQELSVALQISSS